MDDLKNLKDIYIQFHKLILDNIFILHVHMQYVKISMWLMFSAKDCILWMILILDGKKIMRIFIRMNFSYSVKGVIYTTLLCSRMNLCFLSNLPSLENTILDSSQVMVKPSTFAAMEVHGETLNFHMNSQAPCPGHSSRGMPLEQCYNIIR